MSKQENLEIKRFGEVSDEELTALKSKYGTVYTLSVLYLDEKTGEEVELIGYLKRPERYLMGMAVSKMDTNPIIAKEMIIEKCWIGGDERIRKDDDAFYSATIAIESLFSARMGELKKK